MSEIANGAGSPQVPPAGESTFIVILDTDPGVRWALRKGLERSGYEVETASIFAEVLKISQERNVGAAIMELLPEAGLTQETISTLADAPNPPRIICASVDSAPQTVIECLRNGAADFLPKPFSLSEVRASVARVLASDSDRQARRKPGSPGWGESDSSLLIGISPSMQELRETIQQVARTDLNCLIRGESGTGKDMAARELHRLSHRHDKPFVKVNCVALPEQLLESELFGYEKGAFTGAVSSKPGRFELAHRGVIFLDEIGEMQASLQAKLLQVIEHKVFTKLGGRRTIEVDVQITAATNADLEERTKEGSFREDLYFRLNEVCIWVPPLSARKEDVPLLVRHFIQKHGRFSGDVPLEFPGEDLEALTQHDWPGNVRELESTIKRWLALGRKALPSVHAYQAQDIPAKTKTPPPAQKKEEPQPAEELPERPERERIIEALDKNRWNRRKTAGELGMSYQTLRRRIEKYGINKPR